MGKRKPVLYEGINREKAEEARRILSERDVEYNIGFGDNAKFQDMPFPVISEGVMDLYGLEAIEKYFSR
tara:strand:+ start:2732 stop:2938 length:207 start_codon:yes stop_codon:yes gene_type:complete